MTKQEFIKNVIDDVTIGGMLPMNIPLLRIGGIINDMIRKFRANDDRATIENIIFIKTAGLGSCRKIKMPDDVKAITRLEFTNNRNTQDVMGGIDENTLRTTNLDNDMVSYASREFYNQMARQIGVRFMPYDFSEFTHELILEGDIKGSNLFAEVAVFIPETALFDIDDFNDLCEAEVTSEYVRANSIFKRKLVGGREIDWDKMQKTADDIMETLQKKWDDQGGDGVMMLD